MLLGSTEWGAERGARDGAWEQGARLRRRRGAAEGGRPLVSVPGVVPLAQRRGPSANYTSVVEVRCVADAHFTKRAECEASLPGSIRLCRCS